MQLIEQQSFSKLYFNPTLVGFSQIWSRFTNEIILSIIINFEIWMFIMKRVYRTLILMHTFIISIYSYIL